jgi:hypothetical protein
MPEMRQRDYLQRADGREVRHTDYGDDMIESLDKTQQDVAVVDKTALKDIITGASRKAALNVASNGLSAAKMTAVQYDRLMTIVELHASNVPQTMAEKRLELARKQPKDATFFAWTAAVERGGLHYYRIQTPGFLIEMDCTQDQRKSCPLGVA